MFNRMSEEVLEGVRDKTLKKKFSTKPTPRDEAAGKIYNTNDKKQPYVPVEMLMSCLIGGGLYIKLDGKRQMSTSKSTLLPGFISIEEHHMPLLNPVNNKAAAWEVDMRQGRNPNGGEAVCIVRPRFDTWRVNFSLLIDTEQIEEKRIRELVDISGRRLGLGDFRPQRKGIYGQFKVSCWEAQKETALAAE
jgi:hypothetical protein